MGIIYWIVRGTGADGTPVSIRTSTHGQVVDTTPANVLPYGCVVMGFVDPTNDEILRHPSEITVTLEGALTATDVSGMRVVLYTPGIGYDTTWIITSEVTEAPATPYDALGG